MVPLTVEGEHLSEAAINGHGDKGVFLAQGCGSDIASQRADELDLECVRRLSALHRPAAVDVACGAGGQAARMAMAGAMVLAIDHYDFSKEVRALALEQGVQSRVRFVQRDMRDLDSLRQHGIASAVLCQRALHYLKFHDAVGAVQAMGRMLCTDGRLFLSASGISSELGGGYAVGATALADRHGPLAPDMQAKHGIYGSVCLYSIVDMQELLSAAGMTVESLYVSSFGNVKAIAKRQPG